jgi:hypothetical protein
MTTDTEFKTWDEMTPEEQAEFQRASEARYTMWLYNQYQSVVDAITERYDVPWHEALDAASSFVTSLEEEAAEEARRKANEEDAEEIAEEICHDNGWDELSLEEDEDD